MNNNSNKNANRTVMTTAQRKQRLIQEGAAYRAGLINATDEIKDGLHPGLLFRGVIGHILSAASGVLKGHTGGGKLGLSALVPLVMSGVTVLARKSLLKPAIGGAILLGTIAAAARFIKKRKSRPS
jgi:hypothetical protein